MIINKQITREKKGKTVCYTLSNFRYDDSDSKLKWDAFKFYTPVGNQVDDQGFHYFDVLGDEVLIERDDTLNKGIEIKVISNEGVEVIEIYEGAETEAIIIGLEGDIIVSGSIPADLQAEIIIDYKEVTHG
ncbi:MAG: hypothetical protein GTN82_02205 [Candidatus Aminicenantes bacterium]|nr:hypothetical protein [Candidatus Aminicenantes bacterium]